MIGNLVSKHVDELKGGGLEDCKVINLLFLEFREHKLLQVLAKNLKRNANRFSTRSVCVLSDGRGNNEVKDSRFLDPFPVAVCRVLAHKGLNESFNQAVHISGEPSGQ